MKFRLPQFLFGILFCRSFDLYLGIPPTVSVGFAPANMIGLKTVIPPHNDGPSLFKSIPLAKGMAQNQCPLT